MSTTIDERVVEMRFDNQNFEHNAARTMSTLEKLKQKLNLTGASKGLENINSAAKNVNMNGLGSAVDTVTAKFSALQVMGTTALVRITNQAMAAGEKMVKALTIDPVKTGFQEYETQINAVQTILANTSSKGSTIDDVNKALEELNKYADKTIYNFTEMTRNIGTFTAAGVDLETSTNAIQGIANLAAVSGSTSQQASTAMYQLSQALASGTVKLMDWNSVVNAGMGGEVFQNALKETARVHGIAIDDMIKSEGSFRETLKDGWLTSEILTETLQKFTLTTEGLTDEQIEANKQMLKAKGYTEDQIEEIFKLGRTATDAATKVKTFTQLWDVMKESAQSGWSQTWKLLIGDFEEAKAFLTPLADFLTGAIGKMSDFRNAILEKALNNPFVNTLKSISNVTEGIGAAVKSITDYNKVVDEIIGGKWGDGQARWDKLAEAGYDWAHAQNLVNEKLGSSVRRATDYKEAQEGVTEAQERSIESLIKKTDAELRDLNLTEEQISALRFLEKQAEKTGIPVEELAKDMDLLSGRSLLMNSFKNVGKALVDVFTEIRWAWRDIFYGEGVTDEEIINKKAMQLYDLIAALHKLTTYLEVDSDRADKLRRTFKGLFAIVDVVTTLVGGGFKIAFNLIKSILGYFNLDILDLTANIGDVLVKFRDWVDSVLNFDGVVSKLMPTLIEGAKAIKRWGEAFLELPFVQNIITTIKDSLSKLSQIDLSNISLSGIFEGIKNALNTLKGDDYSSIGEFIWDGLIIGLGKGIVKVVKTIMGYASELIDRFKEVLGIHSPSKVFMAIGGFIIAGLILGIKEGAIKVPEALEEIVLNGIDAIKNIDFGKIMAAAFGIGLLKFFTKIGNALENFSEPFAAFGDVLEESADAVKRVSKSFAKLTKAIAFNQNMKAIKELAISIAILAGTVVAIAFIITKYDLNMWEAVGMIGALAAILVGMAVAMNLLSKASIDISKKGIKMEGMTTSLLAIAGAIAILALVVKLIGGLNWKQAVGGFAGLVIIMGLLVGFVWLCGKVGDYKSAAVVTKLSGLLTKLAISLLLMVAVCKLVGKLEAGEMIKGGLFAAAFLVFIGILADLTRNSSDIDKVGGMMIKMAIAMALMVGVCKLVGKLDPVDAIAGFAFAFAFGLFVKSLVKSTKIAKGQEIAKLGGLLMAVSFSMLLMVALCKLVGKLTTDELIKGALFAGGFVLLVKALISITKIGKKQKIAEVAGTILAVAGAIAILAVVAMILSLMETGDLIKGVTAVGILGLLMMGLIKALNGAKNVHKSIVAMAVAIGILAAAVGLLSLIDPKKLIAPTIAMGLLIGMFSLMMKCTKQVKGCMTTMVTLVITMGLMAGLLALLSGLDAETAIQNAGALGILLLATSGAMVILSKMKAKAMDALKAIGLLTAMAVPMIVFVLILRSLDGIENVEKNVLLLVGVMTAMTLLLGVLTIIGNFGVQALAGVIALTAMFVPMFAFIKAMEMMSGVEVVKEKVLLLVGVMTAMTLLLGVLTIIGFGAISALAGVIALTAMVVPMLAFLWIIKEASGIDMATGNIMQLISMMYIMTDLLVVLALVGPMALIGVTALTALTGLMGAIGLMAVAIGALVETFPSLQTFLDTGIDILIQIAGGIGEMIGAFVKGALTQISASLPEIGTNLSLFMANVLPFVIGAKLVDEKAITGVKNLAAAILYITAADLIASLVQALDCVMSLPKLGTQLSKFMTNALPFVAASRLVDQTVVDSAKSLAEIILTLTAADLISGVASLFGGGTVDFENLGTTLTNFAEAVVGFSKAIVDGGGINSDAIDSAVKAGELIVALNDSLPASNGWAQKILGEKDLDAFAVSCILFANSMIAISNALTNEKGDSKINDKAIKDATKAGELFSALQNSLPESGGLLQKIVGQQELASFGESCKAFGQAMIDFSDTVGDKEINIDAAKKAKDAGVVFVALQEALANSDTGILDKILDKDDLAKFGESCKAFGTAISDFCSNSAISEDAVDKANYAGDAMIALQEAIPESTWFDGKMDLAQFGDKIKTFGEKLKGYADKVSEIDIDDMTESIAAAQDLVDLADDISDMDKIDTGNFNVSAIGNSMKSYYDSVKDIDEGKVKSTVNSAVTLSDLIWSLVDLDTSGISKFDIKSIGSRLQKYAEAVTDIDTGSIKSSINVAEKLAEFLSSLSGISATAANNFKTAVNVLGTISVDEIAKGFSEEAVGKIVLVSGKLIQAISTGMEAKKSDVSKTAKGLASDIINAIKDKIDDFGDVGKKAIAKLASGIKSQKAVVKSTTGTCVSAAVTKARGYYDNFNSAGSYLVSGFASGIDENTYKAEAKAKAMAEAAYEAAKEALKINSPSKIFRALAYSVPEGFAMGIDKGEGMVRDSAVSMSDTAIGSVRDSISRMRSIISGDAELQPTIRPVLDLSDIESGAGNIDNMFGSGISVGASADLNAVSSMMSGFSQNGGTGEIVSAIDKLRKGLGNIGGTTYQINGVSYDDGSNIADAVETIARAALRERRT